MSEAALHVIDAQGRRVVALDMPALVIGRRSGVGLQLAEADISREHAEIVRDGSRYVLRDRGSTHGTFVNGQQITERTLVHGDHIRLGRTAVDLVFVHEAGEADASGLRAAASEGTDLRQLAAVMHGLRALGSGRVLDEVLTLVVDAAIDVTKADRGFVMLAGPAGTLELRIARGRGKRTLLGIDIAGTSEKIPRDVFRTRQRQIVADLMDASVADAHGGTIAGGVRHVLCVPLIVTPMGSNAGATGGEHVIGVLYLDGRERSTLLSEATIASLDAFATQAALAIESARLYAESAEKARTDRDLRIAAEIQRALLPQPTFTGRAVDVVASTVPCRTIGGDFYDYLEVAEGCLGFCLGDVAGKGPPAAILAAAVQTNFAALAPIAAGPADTMRRINRALLRRAVDGRFATMFHGTLCDDGRFAYCNAGQDPPVLVRREGVAWLETGGPVLGLLPGAEYAEEAVRLAPGDLIVACSDGVSEARNAAGDEFGRERFLAAVRECHGEPPDVVLAHVMAAVSRWVHEAAPSDDITAMVVRFRGY